VAIDEALISAEKAISSAAATLSGVSTVLSNTISGGALTQTTLDTFKNSIQLARNTISTQLSSIVSVKQGIANAKNSLATFQIAYDKATRLLEQTKAQVDSMITIRQAAYNQAVASLAAKVNPPRAVDVASYRAALAQAIATRDRAYLYAPIDGQITKITKKPGELVSSADPVVQILSPHYEIQVDIAEVDVPKIKIGDKVVITLDAFGPDTKFNGEVAVIDPASTLIQDVVYYKVRIRLDDTKQSVKPGMTANVSVATAQKENTLFVPARTIRTRDDGSRYVRVLVGVNEEERDVKLGLRGNEGKTEILSGVSEGEKIIVSKKEAGA
jgi:HlyD family secretion protein